jgi:hypothetical protein
MNTIELLYSIIVNGNTIIEDKSRSFVHNFHSIVYSILTGSTKTIKDTNNNTHTISPSNPVFFNNNSSFKMCRVGNSSNPLSFDDYNLDGEITSLTLINSTVYEDVIVSPGGRKTIFESKYKNNTTNTYQINRIGLFLQEKNMTFECMVAEDEVSTVTLNPNDNIQITYTLIIQL